MVDRRSVISNQMPCMPIHPLATQWARITRKHQITQSCSLKGMRCKPFISGNVRSARVQKEKLLRKLSHPLPVKMYSKVLVDKRTYIVLAAVEAYLLKYESYVSDSIVTHISTNYYNRYWKEKKGLLPVL